MSDSSSTDNGGGTPTPQVGEGAAAVLGENAGGGNSRVVPPTASSDLSVPPTASSDLSVPPTASSDLSVPVADDDGMMLDDMERELDNLQQQGPASSSAASSDGAAAVQLASPVESAPKGVFGALFGSLFGSSGSVSNSVSGSVSACASVDAAVVASHDEQQQLSAAESNNNSVVSNDYSNHHQIGGSSEYDGSNFGSFGAGDDNDDHDDRDRDYDQDHDGDNSPKLRRLNQDPNNGDDEGGDVDGDMQMEVAGGAGLGGQGEDADGSKLSQLELDVDVTMLSNEELKARVKQWFNIFCPPSSQDMDNLDLASAIARDLFGRKKRRPEVMHDQFTIIVRGYITMYSLMVQRGVLNEADVSEGNLNEDFICIARNVRNVYDITLRAEQIGMSGDSRARAIMPGDKTLFSYFTPLDMENEPPYRKLLRFLLNRCEHQQFAKRMDHDHVYAPYVTPIDPVTGKGGYFTHSYKQVTTMERFVCASVSPKEQYSEQWGWMYHARRNRVHVAEDLKTCVDWQFPYFQKDRYMLAWLDGMYVTYDDRFYRWDNEDDMRILNKLCFGTSSSGTATKEVRRCAAKFHNQVFDNDAMEASMLESGTHWYYALETPAFQEILDFQDLPKEVCCWVYVMFGRLLYYVGEKDNWQVQLFIKGLAGTGKSTMLRHFMSIFEMEDVGIIGNNVEVNFSLEALQECFAWFALDIKENFRLDQTTWQSMVSGEEVSIAQKHKTALMKQWNSPGIIASNVTPNWNDNAGSVSRRMLNLNLRKLVKKLDPTLKDRLHEELAVFVKKCNLAYHKAVEAHGKKDIWDAVKESTNYFHEESRRFKQHVNPLSAFVVDSGIVQVKEGSYMKLSDFNKEFEKYFRVKRPKQDIPTFCEEYYTSVFQYHDIVVEHGVMRHDDCDETKDLVQGPWVLGICEKDVALDLEQGLSMDAGSIGA